MRESPSQRWRLLSVLAQTLVSLVEVAVLMPTETPKSPNLRKESYYLQSQGAQRNDIKDRFA